MPSPRPGRGAPDRRPRVVVLGDLMLDVVIRPMVAPRPGTDVPGRIQLRAGGSAANTARWLSRLGTDVALIGAVGRDRAGRALAASLRVEGVALHLVRSPGDRTGRVGVLVSPHGERSFVTDRGAADRLGPDDVRAAWLAGVDLLHLPAYSLLGASLGLAAMRAIELARGSRAAVSLDLASTAPLLAEGWEAAMRLVRRVAPDLLFATASEAAALTAREANQGARDVAAPGATAAAAGLLVGLAPIVILKRGADGATILARSLAGPAAWLDVPTRAILGADSTGAGDAFDAGFLAAWLGDRRARGLRAGQAQAEATPPLRMGALRRAARAGHRAARQVLVEERSELPLL